MGGPRPGGGRGDVESEGCDTTDYARTVICGDAIYGFCGTGDRTTVRVEEKVGAVWSTNDL